VDDRRDRLSDAKRELLARRLRGRTERPRPADERSLSSRGAPVRLTPDQEPLWIAQRLFPESAAWVVSDCVRLRGPLDVEKLEAALEAIVARHDALRAVIEPATDGTPFLVERATAPSPLLRIAADSVSTTEPALDQRFANDALEHARERLRDEMRKPFDLATGPLFRAILIDVGPDDRLFALAVHHLVADEWSLGIIWRELELLYGAGEKGEPALPPARGFLEVARERASRSSPAPTPPAADAEGASRNADGKERSAPNVPPHASLPPRDTETSSFPFDRPRPPAPEPIGRLLRRELPGELSRALDALVKSSETTPIHALVALVAVLVERWTRCGVARFGLPVTTRGPEDDGVGYFLRTATIDIDLTGDPSFRDVLRQARDRVLSALAAARAPADRSGSRAPRAPQVLVVLLEEPMRRLGEMAIEPFRVDLGVARLDLSFFVEPHADRPWEILCEFRAAIFDEATASRWLEQLETLAARAVERPDDQVSLLDASSTAEAELVAEVWGRGPEAPRSRARSVLDLIDERVRESPDAIAARSASATLRYRELDERSRRLARELRREGAGPGVLVGVYLDRSVHLPVAILGVLRAGAASVPLDPSYPALRSRAIAADAELEILVTSRELRDHVPCDARAIVLADELAGGEVPPSEAADLGSAATVLPDDLAYVIYTSGSTGRPKGVEVEHGQLLASTLARDAFYEEPARSFLLLSSFAFDSSVAGIFWTLASGGTIRIVSEDELYDACALARIATAERITHLLAIPSLWSELIDLSPDGFRDLHVAIVAGEACTSDLVRRHQSRLPAVALSNEYGPTEATVWCAAWRAPPGFDRARVPIGRAIPGAILRVVDAKGRSASVGAPGELWVGGPTVARGYRGASAQDRERFGADPLGREPGRFYRTGDLVRFDAHGDLEFLGRADEQVKVRGHRIELAEIEEALREHEAVTGAAAVIVPGEASSYADTAEVDDLARRLAEFPESLAEEILREAEASSAERRDERIGAVSRTEERTHVEVTFRLKAPEFISTPRPEQRDWLLRQALAESADDLEHLDRIATRFVPGAPPRLHGDYPDVGERRLERDEIMEDWQVPIMREMARLVASPDRDVLEIGFGRGVAATFVDERRPRSHTIVEPNPFVIEEWFEPWRSERKDRDIRLLRGRWQDVTSELERYDGILFHAFPLDEREFIEHVLESVTYAEHAFGPMAALLRPGGVFTYLTTEIDSLARRHQRALFAHFREISLSVLSLEIPADTRDAWWADSMVIVRATR